jgi:hypothetical protein
MADKSRKARVRELHDKEGAESAWVLGQKLGLTQGTLRAWFYTWRKETKPKAKSKPKAKAVADETQPVPVVT